MGLRDFFSSVLASLLAAIVAWFSAVVLSQKARFAMTAMTTAFLGIDTEYVFQDRQAAQKDMEKEFLRSPYVDLLTGRGGELQNEPFAKLLGERPEGLKTRFRVLLPQIDVGHGEIDWTAINERELAALDKAYLDLELLKPQIRSATEILAKFSRRGHVEARCYNMPHLGRIVLTDRVAYFVSYDSITYSRKRPVVKVRAGGIMYDYYRRLFDLLWEHAPDSQRSY